MTELETVAVRARQGDARAQEVLVQRFQEMALSCAFSILGDYDLAEDARQEAFVSAFCDLMSMREPAAFPGRLRRIAQRHAQNLVRVGEDFGVIASHTNATMAVLGLSVSGIATIEILPTYHLGLRPPCADTGRNADASATDIDGDPRPLRGDASLRADIGADELNPETPVFAFWGNLNIRDTAPTPQAATRRT